MSKYLSAEYYQENNKRLQKKLVKDIKIFLKKKKKKKQQYGQKCYKNLSEDEKQNLVGYRKSIIQEKKHFIIVIKNIFLKKIM